MTNAQPSTQVQTSQAARQNGPGTGSRRVGLYARVSTDQQDPAMQVDALQGEAKRRGWIVAGLFVDRGVSGAKDRRKELDRLTTAVRAGEIDAVMVWRFDRFARSVRHLLQALDEFRDHHVEFVSMNENIDTSTALGTALFTIVAAVAQLERDIIRERVQAGVARARKHRGSWGRPKRWTDAQLAKARELRASGKSWREVAMAVGLKVRTIRRALSQAAAVAKALPDGGSP